jgi:DDE superfamily endonuclease
MALWREWLTCVRELRSACARTRTFCWMLLALVGLSVRDERAGVTSLVRALGLQPRTYRRLLCLFHARALDLDKLTAGWIKLALRRFRPLRLGSRLVFVADGIKVPKEGRKMPAVKKLFQGSENNSKPTFIFGHSFEALGLLVHGPLGHIACVPLLSRIQEGLVFSNRDQRSLLDKFVQLFLSITSLLEQPALVVADSYYCTQKVIRPLLDNGHHLITRMKCNAVVYQPAELPRVRSRGRPRIYGDKLRLQDLWKLTHRFQTAKSPLYGERQIEINYFSIDLLWRPVGRVVRLVFARHPTRGRIVLLSSDTSLDPLQVLALYGYRFKIEVGFRQALYTLGSYAYHFWMMEMTPISRRSGNQHLHMKTERYRTLVRRKMLAYHRYVQLGCVAQGLLQHLALNFRAKAWELFGSWLRTMKTTQPPSEAVVAQALRNTLPQLLPTAGGDHELKKFILRQLDIEQCRALRLAG